MDWSMLLKMTGAVLLYVLITAGLWRLCRDRRPLRTGLKILIGLVFGACSIVANHLGIRHQGVQALYMCDMGPLSAGLFFSPLSGILAGIIGGGERILAGELWNIGRITELACALSTFLAGFLAAFLNKWIYKGERPAVPQAFFLGALTEVFHMYAILFTNRGSMASAYAVVRLAAVPMIAFTAVGMALCAAAVKKISGEKMKPWIFNRPEKIPISIQVQIWLLAATAVMFVFNFIGSYRFQTRKAIENVRTEVAYSGNRIQQVYRSAGDIETVRNYVEKHDDGLNVTMLVRLADGRCWISALPNGAPDLLYCEPDEIQTIREHLGEQPFILPQELGERTMMYVVPIGEDHAAVTVRSLADVYDNLESEIYENTLSDILLFTVFYILMSFLVEYLVVRNLKKVNGSLDRITKGRLEEKVEVRSSPEFSGLSDDINQTVAALKGYIDAAEKRIDQELKLAAEIQDSALPKNFRLETEKAELYALMTPARQVGGDFYDFFYIGTDQLCLVIADVSGKSIPASLFMMRAKTAIKDYARGGQDPARLLESVNGVLYEENDTFMFVTVWLGILDLKTGLMRCCSAGHEYPAVLRDGGSYELLNDPRGTALGVYRDNPMTGYEIRLKPGDRIFVYTDGVTDAVNEKKEHYGKERLTKQLNRMKDAEPKELLEGVLRDIRDYAGTAEQFDDLTMLCLEYKGKKE